MPDDSNLQLSAQKKESVLSIIRALRLHSREGDGTRLFEEDLIELLRSHSFSSEELKYTLDLLRRNFPQTLLTPMPSDNKLRAMRKGFGGFDESGRNTLNIILRAFQHHYREGKSKISETQLNAVLDKEAFTNEQREYAKALLRYYFGQAFAGKSAGEEKEFSAGLFDKYLNAFFLHDGLGKWMLIREAQKQQQHIDVMLAQIRYIEPGTFGSRPSWWTHSNERKFYEHFLVYLNRHILSPLSDLLRDRSLIKKPENVQLAEISKRPDSNSLVNQLYLDYANRRFSMSVNKNYVKTHIEDGELSLSLPICLKECMKVWLHFTYSAGDEEYLDQANALTKLFRKRYTAESYQKDEDEIKVSFSVKELSPVSRNYLGRSLAFLSTAPGNALRFCNEFYNAADNELRKVYDAVMKYIAD